MSRILIQFLSYFEPACCALALISILRAREAKAYPVLLSLLCVHLASNGAELALLEVSARHTFPATTMYVCYFYTYWISFAAQTLLSLYVILSIFRLAMAPLKGLRTLGMLVFRWAAGISVALATAIGFAPHESTTSLFSSILLEFQQITGVISLCLLLFVCFAIRPLGLTFRSRVFGVALGLGVIAATNLTGAAWVAHRPGMYSGVSLVVDAGSLLGMLIWSAYFLVPEPKRRIIVLPTTSPFLRWNQISEILGDEPGYVAIAGVPPEVFAPAELEMMARASAKMRELSTLSESTKSAPSLETLTA